MFIYLGQKYLGGRRGRDCMVVGFTKQFAQYNVQRKINYDMLSLSSLI
jgi:hypothetical protein